MDAGNTVREQGHSRKRRWARRVLWRGKRKRWDGVYVQVGDDSEEKEEHYSIPAHVCAAARA